jgi:photosystem II stability/assembly factor-like uncharacterized protein
MSEINSIEALRRANPVEPVDVESLSAHRVFDELFVAIVSVEPDDSPRATPDQAAIGDVPVPSRPVHRDRRILVASVAAVVVLAVILPVIIGGGHPGRPATTRWRGARPLPSGRTFALPRQTGSWELVDDLASSGWQQDTTGPPPGTVTCPTSSSCYALAGAYASPDDNAPLLSESLYVSGDLGLSWSVLPMPQGFQPSTPLSCADAATCSVGGTISGRATFLTTTDGGHQWGEDPVKAGGTLISLTCTSVTICNGVVAPPSDASLLAGMTTHQPPAESLVRTTDAGRQWTRYALPSPEEAVTSMSCVTGLHCLVVGYDVGMLSSTGSNEDGFVLSTSDGGTHWQAGRLPHDFGFAYLSTDVSCSGTDDCMALGGTTVAIPDPCVGNPPMPPPGSDGCSSGATMLASAVVTTIDGGATWRVRPFPTDVPLPMMSGVSCASNTVCWVPGTEAVPVVIGNVHDGGSAVMLGTTDGGSTWKKVTFTVPPGAPNPYGQSYMAIGALSCPTPTPVWPWVKRPRGRRAHRSTASCRVPRRREGSRRRLRLDRDRRARRGTGGDLGHQLVGAQPVAVAVDHGRDHQLVGLGLLEQGRQSGPDGVR